MPTVSINASSRNAAGKGGARKLRAAGQLPAVIYRAGDPATSISLEPEEIESAFRTTNDPNTLVDLQVDGNSRLCLVRSTQRDPASDLLQHIDFYEIGEDKSVTVQVRVTPIGESEGIKLGAVLKYVHRTLPITCSPDAIPDFIEVDITGLMEGQFVRVSGLTPPDGCTIEFTSDYNVIGVVGRRIAVLPDPEDLLEGEEGEEGEEGAEGAEGEGSEDSEESGE